MIDSAIAEINQQTDACFVRMDWTLIPDDVDWIMIQAGTGCSSFVGKIQNCSSQVINVAPGCYKAEVQHELMHALGAYHEHQRPDRAQHVILSPLNSYLSTAQWSVNFDIPGDALSVSSYDYLSVMHYRTSAFAINAANPTVYPRDSAKAELINAFRTGLSRGDVLTINYLVKDKEGGPPSPQPQPQCSPVSNPLDDVSVRDLHNSTRPIAVF